VSKLHTLRLLFQMPNTKIPDNWLDCPKIATEPIEGIVVPLKVPLSSKYRYPKEKEWCWSKALEHYPDIGLGNFEKIRCLDLRFSG